MGLFKLMFLPMKMMMWPMTAPCHMMKRLFKMAFHFVAVMLLVAQLMVMLFMAAMFVMFTVVPTVMFVLFFVMKKMRKGKMGRHGKMHMPMPRRFKP
jgi:hypothetical protein